MALTEASGAWLLEMRNVAKSYGPVRVLEDVGFTLRSGEVRCLAGENGSGKSTLIKIVSGVVRPDSGTVAIGGSLLENDAKAAILAGLSVIYQDFALFPNLTVWENIGFLAAVTENKRIHRRFAQRRRAFEMLARMKVEIDLDALVERLSVASKQLVAIARALTNNARVIIMDEPTTALTRSEVATLLDLVFALKAEGVAFLFVSHKIEEIFAVCDSVTVLRDGHVVVSGAMGEFSPAKLIETMSGRTIESQRLARTGGDLSPTLFRVRDLGRRGQFSSVDLDLRAGEILSVVGLLGSGRTELALTLFGYLSPDEGQIEDGNGVIKLASPSDAMEHGIAYVPEDRLTEGLFLNQPIRDNIVVSSLAKDTRGGFLNATSLTKRARDAVNRLRIKTPDVFSQVVTLSGGNQQRIVLARWMERKPKLLILNGPTVGVDVGSKREIHELLLALSRSGTAILVVTDDIGEAIALSDIIKVMVKGRIVGTFDAKTIDEEALYQEVVREKRP